VFKEDAYLSSNKIPSPFGAQGPLGPAGTGKRDYSTKVNTSTNPKDVVNRYKRYKGYTKPRELYYFDGIEYGRNFGK
jgi:hypothetical protein